MRSRQSSRPIPSNHSDVSQSDIKPARGRERSFGVSHTIALLMGFFLGSLGSLERKSLRKAATDCQIYLGKYRGSSYRNADTVGEPQCLLESKFIRVQQHQVKMGDTVIPDWIFIDYYDRINVFVEAAGKKDEFYVFQQTKYALEDRQSSAIVGGIIEPGEKPEHAARREVSEEIGVVCERFDFLGRFRTDVNRGLGWTHTFLARDCEKGSLSEKEESDAEEVGVADTERQDLTTVSLNDVRQTLQRGDFLEIQWTATVALALQLIDSEVN